RNQYAMVTVCCAAALAPAQDAMLEVRVLNDATPAEPEVQIEVWAHFPPEDYAWAGTKFELLVAEPEFYYADCGREFCESAIPSIVVFPQRVESLGGQVSFPP